MNKVKLKLFLLLTPLLKTKYQMTEKRFKYVLIAILCIVFIAVINKPIEIYPDSEGYLNMEIYRSAGYPIFLWILKQISGSYLNLVTIVVQAAIGLIAIYLFISRLKRLLNLHSFWYLLLSMVMAVPYVYNHQIANNYLSEALTYPLYLLVVISFLESLITGEVKKLWIAWPILMVLIITRSQFLFMVPAALLIILWLAYNQKKTKSYLWIGLAFFILPVLTSLMDKTYHQLKHGHFVNTPWTGIHLIAPAFYVADEEDYQLYDSDEERDFFKSIFTKLYSNHLNVNHLNEDGQRDATEFYIRHYSAIANATIYDSGKELVGIQLSEDQKFIALDQLTKKMALPLVLNNFKSWFKLYIKNSVSAFGSAKHAAIYIILLLVGLVGLFKKGQNDYKVMSLLVLLTFGNVALVAIGMHAIKRFTFYNDWVLFLILFILIDAYSKPIKSNL